MRSRNMGLKIFYFVFIFFICLSWVIWFALEKYVDTTNYENRQKHSQPKLTLETYQQFSSDYNGYINDIIPFRNNLITLNGSIDYFIFGKSTNSRVAVGKDNWLFYCDEGDGNPIACYQGTNLLTEEQLVKLTENCVKQKNFLAAQGVEFVILIAPNKERIYFEKMPKRYGMPAENYRVLQIVDYLKENTDIKVIYPYEEIMEEKGKISENLYYKTDTHWNSVGGYVGSRSLLQELGIELPSLSSDQISIIVTKNHIGDLAGFMGLSQQLLFADTSYSVEGYDTHQYEKVDSDDPDVNRYQSKNSDPRKLLMVRDSFGSLMFPYISSQFSESYFRHYSTYTYNDFVSQRPDIFVYETVERYVSSLMDFSVQ